MFIKPEIYTTKRCLKINITIKISLLLNLSKKKSRLKMEEIEKYDFSNGDEFSDFKLIVDNKSIFVHKAILGNFLKLVY